MSFVLYDCVLRVHHIDRFAGAAKLRSNGLYGAIGDTGGPCPRDDRDVEKENIYIPLVSLALPKVLDCRHCVQ